MVIIVELRVLDGVNKMHSNSSYKTRGDIHIYRCIKSVSVAKIPA